MDEDEDMHRDGDREEADDENGNEYGLGHEDQDEEM